MATTKKRIEELAAKVRRINEPPLLAVYWQTDRGFYNREGEPISAEQYKALTRLYTVVRVNHVRGLRHKAEQEPSNEG